MRVISAREKSNLILRAGIEGGLTQPLLVSQVSDCLSGNIASSSVFQAFNYAVRMGAHIVSCSFTSTYSYGFYPVAKAPSYLASQATAYSTAMKPLSDKGILAVVAAGERPSDVVTIDISNGKTVLKGGKTSLYLL